MSAGIHTFTGPYALNALSDVERVAFEEHLEQCGACRQEVGELQETAARLGAAVAAPPPESLKSAITDQLRRIRQVPPEQDSVVRHRRRGWPLGLTSRAAAASLIVAIVLGSQVIQLGTELDGANQRLSQVTAFQSAVVDVLTAGDAKVVTDSEVGVSNVKKKLAFVPQRMPEHASDRTYQL